MVTLYGAVDSKRARDAFQTRHYVALQKTSTGSIYGLRFRITITGSLAEDAYRAVET